MKIRISHVPEIRHSRLFTFLLLALFIAALMLSCKPRMEDRKAIPETATTPVPFSEAAKTLIGQWTGKEKSLTGDLSDVTWDFFANGKYKYTYNGMRWDDGTFVDKPLEETGSFNLLDGNLVLDQSGFPEKLLKFRKIGHQFILEYTNDADFPFIQLLSRAKVGFQPPAEAPAITGRWTGIQNFANQPGVPAVSWDFSENGNFIYTYDGLIAGDGTELNPAYRLEGNYILQDSTLIVIYQSGNFQEKKVTLDGDSLLIEFSLEAGFLFSERLEKVQ